MYGDVLEPLLTFFVAARPFAEVSLLTVVSKTWREGSGQYRASVQSWSRRPGGRVPDNTVHQFNLTGFPESVTDDSKLCVSRSFVWPRRTWGWSTRAVTTTSDLVGRPWTIHINVLQDVTGRHGGHPAVRHFDCSGVGSRIHSFVINLYLGTQCSGLGENIITDFTKGC
jgi:hypothetical protein